MKFYPNDRRVRRNAACLAALLGGLVSSAALSAQQAPVSSTDQAIQNSGPAPVSASSSVEQLPSFQVLESADSGYKASNSVSGTGFNEKIQDLPFSLSALTGDYIKDMGAVDLLDAVETAAGVKSGEHEYTNGADSYYIRGFVQLPLHDGVYEGSGGNIDVDPVDVERVEVAKGPSSLLYGIVSPGGTVNYITKVANDTPSAELTFKAGSSSFDRATLDVNYPLIPGVFDFRLEAALEDGWRAEVIGNENTKVIIPTFTWNILKKVQFRAKYTFFDRQQRPPEMQPPYLNIYTPQSMVNEFNAPYPAGTDAVANLIGKSLSPLGSIDVDQGNRDGSTAYFSELGLFPRNYDTANLSDWLTTTNHDVQTVLEIKDIADHWNFRGNFDYNKNSEEFEETAGNLIEIAPANSLVWNANGSGKWSVAPSYAALSAQQQLVYDANFLTAFGKDPGSILSQTQNGTAPPIVTGARIQRIFGSLGDNYNIQAEAVGSYQTAIGVIRPLIGAYYTKDYFYTEAWVTNGTAAAPNPQPWDVDPMSPTYHIDRSALPQLTKLINQDVLAYDFSDAAYAVLNCSLFHDTLQIVGGARYNSSGETSTNFLGTTFSGVYAQGLMTHLPTYQLGIGYKIRPDVMLYTSYSESYSLPTNTFLSTVGYSSNGTPQPVVSGTAKPVTGEGAEFGIKTDLLNGRIASTFSIYQITESDVQSSSTISYTGPTGINAGVSLFFQGEVIRSDGFEYEVTLSPTDNFQLIFNFSDDFARIIAVPAGYLYFLGSPPAYSTRYTSNAWAKYKLTKHLWIGGGYKAQSKADSVAASLYIWYPRLTEFDAAAGYDWESLIAGHRVLYEVSVNAFNLSNGEIMQAQGTIPLPRRAYAGITVKY